MNIIEAIKSGKPFRRKGWTHADWVEFDKTPSVTGGQPYGGGELKYVKGRDRFGVFYYEDLTATDWEVKDEPLKVEFECANWQAHVCGGSGAEGCIFYYPLLPPGVSTKQFNGKRTRVTITELRDDD